MNINTKYKKNINKSKNNRKNKGFRSLRRRPIRFNNSSYLAPEVYLLHGQSESESQSKSSDVDSLFSRDIWSIGCIFGELLQMIQGNCKVNERGPMFGGVPRCPNVTDVEFGFDWDQHGRDQIVIVCKIILRRMIIMRTLTLLLNI